MFSTSSFFDTSDVMYYMSRCNERRRSFLDPISEQISVESMVNKENKQIRIFVLRENEHLERKLFRLKKGEIVQFVLSGSLFSKKVRLFCNHVQSGGDQFERKRYHKLKWQNPGGYYHDDLNKYAAIEMVQSGTFHFYFTVNDCEHPCGSGYLLVDPILRHSNQKEVSLDSLQCQTVISKCLGKFSDWLDRINVTIHSGFNMIHFTPLQELSHQSNSSYAIHDHLTYNPNFGKVSKSEMSKFIDRLFSDYGLMSVTDLVYNHVATGCLLLENNPEVAYNLKNSPHLRPAFLFDRIIYYFSKDVGEKLLESVGIPKKIESRHLYVIRQHLLTHIFPKYQFHEFVIVDIDKAVTEFRKAISDPKTPRISSQDIDLSKISIIQDSEYRRNMCTIDNNVAVKHLNADWDDVKDNNDRINRCCEMLRNRIADLNNGRRNEITNDVCTGVDNCIANCRYWFFESGASGYESVSANVPIAPL
ncbi:hypothetical protein GJ496_005284 [Pomphorhynchus laevis]|nr:hypothetical protein GJ496_005284 [Pomphorhynchus laevis]